MNYYAASREVSHIVLAEIACGGWGVKFLPREVYLAGVPMLGKSGKAVGAVGGK